MKAFQTAVLPFVVIAMGLSVLPIATSYPAWAQRSLTHDDSDDDDEDHDQACMTSHMLRDFLAKQGYADVKLNAPNRFWQATATMGGVKTLLIVDTCGHRIIHSSQL